MPHLFDVASYEVTDKSTVHQRACVHQEECQACVQTAGICYIFDVLFSNLYGDGVDEVLEIMKIL